MAPRTKTNCALLALLTITAVTLTCCGFESIGGPRTWSRDRLRAASGELPERGTAFTARRNKGNARIGALFQHDQDGDHFCTASVVHSPGRDMLVTAAHCLHDGKDGGYKDDIVFIPNYRDGVAPNGTWQVDKAVVDPRWTDASDPDLDVAFVVLKTLDGRHIEDVLGGNTLGISKGFTNTVKITGYPSSKDEPISCLNKTTRHSAHQMRIECTDFSGGTSGSPWLTKFDPKTRTGTVVGVIGGYQAGGDTDDVSYSPYFDEDVRKLYERATGG